MFLLDTTAASEPGRPLPDAGYLAWFEATPEPLQFFSVLTLGELRQGTQALPIGRRRSQLEALQMLLILKFDQQILPIDITIAQEWSDVSLRHKAKGRAVGAIDELIAATAIAHDMTVVTRNVRDFEHSGCKLLSPWSA